MGQKASPIAVRMGYTRSWGAQWYARKNQFAKFLLEDATIRAHVKKEFYQAAISKVVIERASDKVRVNIHSARPGVIIGRKGADIDRLRESLLKLIGKEVQINIREIKNPMLDAQLLAEDIALQLERRVTFRRAMKKTIQQSMEAGAKGIRIYTKGRLGGAEIARKEGYLVGSVPLQTFRADVDYGFAEAKTTYGKIGVKVWLCRGDFLERPDLFNLSEKDQKNAAQGPQGGGKHPAGAPRRDEVKAKPAEAVVEAPAPAAEKTEKTEG